MQSKDRENTEQEVYSLSSKYISITNWKNKVRLLQKLRHSNIVAYKDSFLDQDQYLNIVMIYCEGGDMHNKIKNAKAKNFPEIVIKDFFRF